MILNVDQAISRVPGNASDLNPKVSANTACDILDEFTVCRFLLLPIHEAFRRNW